MVKQVSTANATSINQHVLSEFYFGKFSQAENGKVSTFIKRYISNVKQFRSQQCLSLESITKAGKKECMKN